MQRCPKPEVQKRSKTPDRNEAMEVMRKYLGDVALKLDPSLFKGGLGPRLSI